MSVTDQRGKASQWLGSLWAGVGSAVICYAEYVALGAVLAPALLGYGAQSKSVGTLLVVASAALACLLLAWRKVPYLAGPRGPSMAVLVMALLWLQQHFPASAATQVALLVTLLFAAAGVQVLAATARGQAFFDQLPPWLVPSFIYASAISIMAGAVNKYVHACLERSEAQTWGIFLSGSLLAIVWPHACKWLSARLGAASRLGVLLSGITGLAFILGAALAWWLFEQSSLAAPSGNRCGRLGRIDLDTQVLMSRWESLAHLPLSSDLWWAILAAALCGVMVGVVCAIETKTGLQALRSSTAPVDDKTNVSRTSRIMRLMALATGLLGGITSVPPSVAPSRSLTLASFSKPTPQAVLIHAIALIALALLAGRWLAYLPQLALAVMMTAVAAQMVSNDAIKIWQAAYNPEVPVTTGLRAGVGFWLVTLISACTQQPLLGLLLPAVLYYAIRYWRGRQAARLRSAG